MTRVAAMLLVGVVVVCAVRAEQYETIEFSGDRTEIVLADGREFTRLVGNANVRTSDLVIQAGRIELSGDEFRYANARDDVSAIDEEAELEIRARGLYFDRETEFTRAERSVIITDAVNDLVLRGELLELHDDILEIQVSVRVLRDDLTARAQFLRYRRNDDILELSGFPVVFWNGDEYRARRIVMNLETEEIDLIGQVQGSVQLAEDEAEETESDAADAEPAEAEENVQSEEQARSNAAEVTVE